MDKKINLEHTIRVVVAESLGGGITTDKYVRTGNSFFKSVHIEPKKGDEHTPVTGAVRSNRNTQKERSSETMREEEQLDELLKPLVTTIAKKYGDDAIKMLDDLLKTEPKVPAVPKKVPTKKPDSLPYKEPEPVKMPELPPLEPSKLPAPVKAPEVKPTQPKLPEVKPEVKPQTKPEVKPETTPTLPKLPEVKPQTKPEVKIDTPTTTATKDAKPVKIELPNSQVKPSSKTQEMMKRINKLKDENNDDRKEDKKEDKKRKPFGFPSISISREPINALRGYVPVNTYMHFATDRRTFGEEINPQDAEEIKAKTKKAQIIRKIIDEQKKKKDTSTVNLHPKLKNQEPDQN